MRVAEAERFEVSEFRHPHERIAHGTFAVQPTTANGTRPYYQHPDDDGYVVLCCERVNRRRRLMANVTPSMPATNDDI